MSSKPVKHSVAVLVRRGGRILTIRRPDDDDELPGIWGLPAGTFKENEGIDELIRRIGGQKLGVHLKPVRKIAEGRQERPRYVLEMGLWEAEMAGLPSYPDWAWDNLDVLKEGALQGSLCCELALRYG